MYRFERVRYAYAGGVRRFATCRLERVIYRTPYVQENDQRVTLQYIKSAAGDGNRCLDYAVFPSGGLSEVGEGCRSMILTCTVHRSREASALICC